MRIFSLIALSFLICSTSFSQDTLQTEVRLSAPKKSFKSPYETKLLVDGPITVGAIGLNLIGVKLIENKRHHTPAELAAKNKNNLPFFDRGNAGYYSKKADSDSYIPFQASFAMPVVMSLIDKNERSNLLQVLVLYTETMAITGAFFTMTAGTVYRSRPYVYGTVADYDLRLDNDSRRSFYAGHTAATASATFFMAKAFSDFNPDSKARPYVWGVAAAVPAVVGYLRYKAGMHFLSDNILGYVMGAGVGILVPELHKNKKLANITLVPQYGDNYKGVSLTYKF